MRTVTRSLSALFLVASVASTGAVPAHAAPAECTLSKTIKVSIKKPSGNEWVEVARGTKLTLKNRGAQWSDVTVPDGSGRANTAVLDGACDASLALAASAVSAATAAPAASPAAAAPAADAAPAAPAPSETPAPVAPAAAPEPVVAAPTPAPEPVVDAAPAAAVVVPAGVPASAERIVAVLDFKPGIGAEGVAEALTTVVTAEVGARAGLKAISRNEIKAIVANQANAALLGCETPSCAADLAKLAHADLVIAGTVEKLGEAHVLAMTLIDPSVPAVLDRQEVAWRGAPAAMVGLARPYVDRLFAEGKAASYEGALEVFAPEGALVIVDGKELGRAPLAAAVRGLSTGVHTIDVVRDGYDSHHGEVIVARNETTIARVELVEQPFYTQWWFWGATGGAVLVAGGVVAGITTLGILDAAKDKPASVVLGPSAAAP